MPLLAIKGLTKRFFGLIALDHVDIEIERGELVGLIGPNGSGKTTLFNCVTGFLRADEGTVMFKGQDVTHHPPYQLALMGLCRTFQLVSVFPALTVLENLLIALQQHQENNIPARIFKTPQIRFFEQKATSRALELLEFVGLSHLKHHSAGTLSYGQRKLLMFAAVLMPDPDIILLDEPASGVNPTMINKMKDHILELHRMGKTIFLVEHNMEVVMELCQRVTVLDHGEKIAEGHPRAIQNNPRVLEAYLGR